MMNEQIHLAIQYLATAGKSFLEHKEDDSHTNVGFDSQNKRFETWPLNKSGTKMTLDLHDFSISWIAGTQLAIGLAGKTHSEIVTFLKDSAQQIGFDHPYEFELHYDIPFDWDADYTYGPKNQLALHEILRLRTVANKALEIFMAEEGLHSEIRVWPHHFDTGGFAALKNSDKSIGFGMAIPDTLVDDHYFYISGYRGYEGIETSGFSPLRLGEWKNEGFKGAVMPASKSNETQAVQFFRAALQNYTAN